MSELQARPPATVAVMIAAYNARRTIARAVSSALAEPEVTEVWVIDDCSTDGTPDAAAAADDGTARLRVLRQTSNGGPAAARNRALSLSSAAWVCVLDSDDYLLPGRTGRLLAQAAAGELVADDLIRVSLGDATPTLPAGQAAPLEIDLAQFVEGNVSRRGRQRQELGFIKPLMDRRFLARHGLNYNPDMRLGEDYDLYARALAWGARLILVPPQGYVAVTRPDSLSGRHTIEDLQALRDCSRTLATLPHLSAPARQALRRHYRSVDKRLQWRRLIEAVKTGNAPAAVSTLTSGPVALHLGLQLAEQAWLRLFRRKV